MELDECDQTFTPLAKMLQCFTEKCPVKNYKTDSCRE